MAFLFILIPFLLVLILVFSIFRGLAQYSLERWRTGREHYGAYLVLPAHYREPLEKYFPYYQLLDAKQQARFRHRMVQFIKAKQFVARGGLNRITPEMISLISATAVMLSFGMRFISFTSFKRILVYPTDYYSKINRAYHKGEVNPAHGLIIVSWEHFVNGLVDTDDGINLGIHEMAHALHLEDRIRNREYDYFHTSLLAYWTKHARWEMEKIASGRDHLFRAYAATNDEEFFAVAMENFFERPAEFRDDLPELYHILVRLLQQDPADGVVRLVTGV